MCASRTPSGERHTLKRCVPISDVMASLGPPPPPRLDGICGRPRSSTVRTSPEMEKGVSSAVIEELSNRAAEIGGNDGGGGFA